MPQPNLTSYTFTRESADDGVRVVCLWNAEKLEVARGGRQADCLRLVSVGTRADGKTEVGHGLFDTGIHPIPATTRVLMEVSFDTDSSGFSSQNAASPSGSRRFFGVRDSANQGLGDPKFQYNFQISRTGEATLRVDPCNYLDGVGMYQDVLVALKKDVGYQIDVNPTYTLLSGEDGFDHIAELKKC